MIVPSDPDYISIKLIKKGSEQLDRFFQQLSSRVSQQFDTKVLNIYYDKIDTDKNRPRLNIIFEFETERTKFTDNDGNFDSTKQKIIADAFIEILKTDFPTKNFDTKRLFVIFSAFEPVARIEAAWNTPKKEIEKLKKQLQRKNVWEVYQEFEITTIFFYKEKQIEEYTNNGTIESIKSKFLNILKKYDEFDYINQASPFVAFDSKEKFDDYYQGNWFYYSRR